MSEIEYKGVKYDVYASDIYLRCEQFFKTRFNRAFNPKVDSYAQEWLERFFKGMPDVYMDSQSLRVYLSLIKGELS